MKLKYLLFIPAILMMIQIFIFSSAEADQSTVTSTSVGRVIVKMAYEISGQNITSEDLEEKAVLMDGYVRKSAHMAEYAILTFFFLVPLIYFNGNWKNKITCVIIFCIFYAGTDEFHQTFVKGRSGSIRDVAIDSIGVFAAGLIFTGLKKIVKQWKQKVLT